MHEAHSSNETQLEMDVTNLSAGFYFITIEDNFGKAGANKLILEK